MKKRTKRVSAWVGLSIMVVTAALSMDPWYIVACICILIGAVLNLTAMYINDGKMPVRCINDQHEYLWASDCHRPMLPTDRMKILCDWIPMLTSGRCSIGDVIIDATIICFLIRIVKDIVWQ